MFPVPTGMNREYLGREFRERCVPRAHGDEPPLHFSCSLRSCVFPVPTGMNQQLIDYLRDFASVPRAHGDEPMDKNSQ